MLIPLSLQCPWGIDENRKTDAPPARNDGQRFSRRAREIFPRLPTGRGNMSRDKKRRKKIPALFFRDTGKLFQSKRESIAAAAASSGEMYPSRAMSMSTMAVRCFASSGWSMGSYADGA